MTAEQAGYWLWGVWYVTWWIAAFWADRAAVRPRGAGIVDRLVTGVGVLILFWFPVLRSGPLGALAPLWTAEPYANWALVAGIAASFAFCWWARIHMGRLWSGLVTAKPDHYIVDTGPFRLVRHPIYSGAISAAFCLALIKATPAALVGALMILIGFWMTARKEERFLREQLGTEAYDAYSRETPMFFSLPR